MAESLTDKQIRGELLKHRKQIKELTAKLVEFNKDAGEAFAIYNEAYSIYNKKFEEMCVTLNG